MRIEPLSSELLLGKEKTPVLATCKLFLAGMFPRLFLWAVSIAHKQWKAADLTGLNLRVLPMQGQDGLAGSAYIVHAHKGSSTPDVIASV